MGFPSESLTLNKQKVPSSNLEGTFFIALTEVLTALFHKDNSSFHYLMQSESSHCYLTNTQRLL